MTLDLRVQLPSHTDFVPRITVIGVGGGGTNAVDNMIALNLQGVDFVVANTDAQQLQHSKADRRIQLGPHITQGLGAGAKPEIGRAAAEEAADELYRHLDNTHMVFITAGMGGGTGTGAAPVIARMARERNILTVGVVTKPFTFEGARRARAADAGIEELQQYVDTLIVIPNQNLFRLANEKTGWGEAFKMADDVLYMGVRGVTDLMITPGLVNLDFADIRAVMAEMGKAMMGTGEAEGDDRAIRASERAISNPLLEDTSMAGARGLLINITGGNDLTLFEVDQAANRIREEVDENANIIFGSAIDPALQGKIRVSVVATGIDSPISAASSRPRLVAVENDTVEAERANGTTGFAPPGYAGQGHTPAYAGQAQAPSGAQGQPSMASGYAAQPGYAAATPLRAPQRPVSHQMETAEAGQSYGSPPVPQVTPLRAGQAARAAYDTATLPQAAPPASSVSRTLFTESQPAARQAPPPPPPPRHSLFHSVTMAFRRPPPDQPLMPNTHQTEPGYEPREARPSVRPLSAEESTLEIPAFLRRQSS